MSKNSLKKLNRLTVLQAKQQANVFAALGDPTRLLLITKLIDGKPRSILALTGGTKITRQAITKHLSVLEDVGLVSKIKEGRESLYELDAKPLEPLREYLDVIADQWDKALHDLKAFVEK
jgi:DNA-binding transcriptional ArsR family regulator